MQNFYHENGVLHQKLYRFKSAKSNQVYLVWLEFFPFNFIAVKFHLKIHKHSKTKYHLLTDCFEPRRIIHTCIKIMLDANELFPTHSFCFLGANSYCTIKRKDKISGEIVDKEINEDKENTKRFQRYKKIVLTLISDKVFEHFDYPEHSVYILVRKTTLIANPNIVSEVKEYFLDNYNDFYLQIPQ